MVRLSRSPAALVFGALVLCFVSWSIGHAQTTDTVGGNADEAENRTQSASADDPKEQAQSPIDDLKSKIFGAHLAQQTLGRGLRFCTELNGKGFYFQVRDRVLDLEEYSHALENLVKAEVYNPDKRRPWSLQDAKDRWEEVKKQAEEDKKKCELVKSLPQLEKQLQDLEAKSENPEKKN
jgi:tRNA nucleotidyltransferase/poly(A) polymerase